MAFPYSGEDMECAAVARATMIAQTPTNTNNNNTTNDGTVGGPHQLQPEESLMGIYSTSESEADNVSNPPSVSTTMLVGTFYDPNTPSDTNSFVSSLQDELSNNGHPRGAAAGDQQAQQPYVSNLLAGGSPTSVVSFPQFFRNSKGGGKDGNGNHHPNTTFNSIDYNGDSFSTLDIPWKSNDDPALVATGGSAGGRGAFFYSRRRICFGVATCLLVTVAVAMGIIIGMNHEQNKTDAAVQLAGPIAATLPPTTGGNNSAEDGEGDGDSTTVPPTSTTISPSVTSVSEVYEPIPEASGMSSTQRINFLVSSLPSYTQQAFENPTSPQKRALHWLTSDPALMSYSVPQMIQRFALKTFYFATNGGSDEEAAGYEQQSWLQTGGWQQIASDGSNQQPLQHECQWYSTHEDNTIEPPCNEQGVYTALSLRRNNLQGSLPAELSLLTSLQVMDLELNSIDSNLPSELGLLTNLKTFVIRSNDVSGGIPSELGVLSNTLVDLQLDTNALTGFIPEELSLLTNLVNLTLDDNQLTGSIPTQLGALTNLENFLLHDTRVTGRIPTEIGQWRMLKSLSLRDTLLTETLPTELGLLTNLERLWAYGCDLTGALPSELGLVTGLTMLSISRNRMTGSLPTELGLLTQLVNLWLYDNNFGGAIPSELGRLTNMELLPLRDNDLTGEVPAELCAISTLEVTIDCLEVACGSTSCDCTCGITTNTIVLSTQINP